MSQSCTPKGYITSGWLSVYRKKLGKPVNLNDTFSDSGGQMEFWSIGERSEIYAKVPPVDTGCWYLTLNLRSPWRGSQVPEKLEISVNDHRLQDFEIHPDVAMEKLLEIPSEWIDDDRGIRIVLSTPDASSRQEEIRNLDNDQVLGVELSALALYQDRSAYLNEIEGRFNAAVNTRDELMDRKNQPMDDRGELVDKARRTLNTLESTGNVSDEIIHKISSFLKDPYVLARHQYEFDFGNEYFNDNYEKLRDGRVSHGFRSWEKSLVDFHAGVVSAGNRAFLKSRSHAELNTLAEGEDPLLELAERLTFCPKKLKKLKDLNDHFNNLEALVGRDRLESIPPALEIEMSSYCNYACVMCGRSWMSFHFNRQSNSQLAILLPALPYINYVTIAGVGENTTSDRLLVLAKLLETFKVKCRIFTNGSMIHKQLDALGRFSKVCISFDGGNAESFETQRRGANFDKVIDNVKKLRAHAPEIDLAFSVVVSRINLGELEKIVLIAADAGVNHVAFSPVWHDSEMQLHPSDQEVYQDGIDAASVVANKHGITIQNNVIPEDFKIMDDKPLDREVVLKAFNGLDKPSNQTPSMEKVEELFSAVDFDYYPNAEFLPGNSWPAAPKNVPQLEPWIESDFDFEFNLDDAIEQCEKKIQILESEIKELPEGTIKIPYCLSIWKYTYTKANSKNRLCPQTNIDVGNIAIEWFKNVTNSDRNREFRRSMFEEEKHPICGSCLDPFRRWGHASAVDSANKLNLEIEDLSKYSTSFK